jgi:hypothetical protein
LAVGAVLGSSGNDSPAPAVPTVITEANLDVPPTATAVPAPTATAMPIRTSCSEIQGTDYRSGEERDWYQQNCNGPSTASAGAGVPAAPRAASGPSFVQVPTGDRVVIPAASVNAEIWKTSAGGSMPDPVGYFNAVTYDWGPGSGLGGTAESGNVVLSGHVDCGRCYNGGSGIAVFWHVRNLKVGDTAQYYASDGHIYNYQVVSSQSYPATANFAPIVASGAADMTLITCTGTFSGGEYNLRHVVAFRKTG